MKDLTVFKGNSMDIAIGDALTHVTFLRVKSSAILVTFEHLNVVEAMKSEENKGKHEERNAERICCVLFFFPTHVAESLHHRML